MEEILKIAKWAGTKGFTHYAGEWYRHGTHGIKISAELLKEMQDLGYLQYNEPDENLKQIITKGRVVTTNEVIKGTWSFTDEIKNLARKRVGREDAIKTFKENVDKPNI